MIKSIRKISAVFVLLVYLYPALSQAQDFNDQINFDESQYSAFTRESERDLSPIQLENLKLRVHNFGISLSQRNYNAFDIEMRTKKLERKVGFQYVFSILASKETLIIIFSCAAIFLFWNKFFRLRCRQCKSANITKNRTDLIRQWTIVDHMTVRAPSSNSMRFYDQRQSCTRVRFEWKTDLKCLDCGAEWHGKEISEECGNWG